MQGHLRESSVPGPEAARRQPRVPWTLGLFAAITLVGIILAVAQAAPVHAQPESPGSLSGAASSGRQTPPSTPPGGLDSPPPTSSPPDPVTITSPSAGTFVDDGQVTVTGTKDPALEVQVRSPKGGDPACSIPAGPANWSCDVSVPDGPEVTITAVELTEHGPNPSASVTVAALGPPTINAKHSHLTSGPVQGTAYPGATVTATADTGQTCSFPADGNGAWGCVLTGLSEGTHTVTATQQAFGRTSNASGPVTFTIDTTRPAAPVIRTPHGPAVSVDSGTAVTFSGTGEKGATVTVYANSYTLCSATVSAHGEWACTARTVPDGTYSVAALQTDAAGNWSEASRVFTLTMAPPDAGDGSGGPGSSDSPEPRPSHSPRSHDGGHATAEPSTPPATPRPTTPPPGHTTPPSAGGGLGGWSETTPFSSAVKPALSAHALPGWLRSLVLALAGLLLLVLPARLLASLVAARRAQQPARGRFSLFGRNHPVGETESSPAARPWLTMSAVLIAAAAMISLSVPVADLPAYLRLLGAVLLAVLAVNAVAAAVPRVFAHQVQDIRLHIVPAPRALLLVAAAAVLSRVFDLQPALLFGIVAGVVIAESRGIADRGRMAAVQIAAPALFGVLAWLFLSVGTGERLPVFAAESLNAVVLMSIGSAAIGLIPLGRLPGRELFAWSRSLWLGMAIVVFTLLIGLLIPVGTLWQHGLGTAVVGALMLGFAGVTVSFWLWQRYIQPSLK